MRTPWAGHWAEVLRGASVTFGVRALGAVLALALNVVLARRLGAAGAGVYFTGLATVSIVSVITRLGLDRVLLREVAGAAVRREWTVAAGWHVAALRLIVPASLFGSAALFVAAPWLGRTAFSDPELVPVLRVFSLAVVPMALALAWSEMLKGLRRLLASQVVQGVSVSALTLGALLLLGPGVSLSAAAWAHVGAATATAALGLWLWTVLAGRADRRDVPPDARRRLLTSGVPLLFAASANLAMTWVGTLALGIWGTAEQVGTYTTAARTAMITSLVLVAMNSIAAPKFAACHGNGDRKGLESTAVASTWLTIAFACPALLVLLLAPGPVMALFGRDFAAGALPLSVLAAGQFFNAASGPVGTLLVMCGHEISWRNVVLGAAGLNVVLAVALVPSSGPLGAAIAATAALVAKNGAAAWLAVRHLGVWPWRLPVGEWSPLHGRRK